MTRIINKPLLLHLVDCLYYLYQWCTVKQISDNEIYLLIKYIKSVLWRVAKRLSYKEDARCLKVNDGSNVSLFEDRSADQSVARTEWSDQDQLLFQRYSTVQAAVFVTVLDMHDATECRFLQSTLESKHSRTWTTYDPDHWQRLTSV